MRTTSVLLAGESIWVSILFSLKKKTSQKKIVLRCETIDKIYLKMCLNNKFATEHKTLAKMISLHLLHFTSVNCFICIFATKIKCSEQNGVWLRDVDDILLKSVSCSHSLFFLCIFFISIFGDTKQLYALFKNTSKAYTITAWKLHFIYAEIAMVFLFLIWIKWLWGVWTVNLWSKRVSLLLFNSYNSKSELVLFVLSHFEMDRTKCFE